MPNCLHSSEMLTASGRSGLNSMIWRRIVAVNVFCTPNYRKSHGHTRAVEDACYLSAMS